MIEDIKQHIWMPEVFWPIYRNMIHSFAFTYDKYIDREIYEWFIWWLADRIPCDECKEHYEEYIRNNEVDRDNDDWLTIYFFNLHNLVNKRNGKEEMAYTDFIITYYNEIIWRANSANQGSKSSVNEEQEDS